MSLKLNMLKDGEKKLRLNLTKRGVHAPPPADVAIVIDVSGSFEGEHTDGTIQSLLERLVPWGMVFDPDKKLDVFTFSDGAGHAHHVGEITPETTEGYVRNAIVNRVPGWRGGTDYSFVLESAMRNFGWLPSQEEAKPSGGGFFAGLFGKKSAPVPVQTTKRPSIVLFITDGDNSDKDRTRQVLRASQDRHDQIYFLFIGVNRSLDFPFLKQIGDEFDNTGLAVIKDIRGLMRADDDVLNDMLIGDELLTWLKK